MLDDGKKKNLLLDVENIVYDAMLYYMQTLNSLELLRQYCHLYAIVTSKEKWQNGFSYSLLSRLCPDLMIEEELGYKRNQVGFYQTGIPMQHQEEFMLVSPDVGAVEAAEEANIRSCFLYGRMDSDFTPYEEEKVPKKYTLGRFSVMDLGRDLCKKN